MASPAVRRDIRINLNRRSGCREYGRVRRNNLITAPWSSGTATFTRVIANNPEAPTDINASISFPSAGGIDLNRSDITLSNTFEFGGSNKGRLELSTGTTGTSLTMRAAGEQILIIDSVITGTAQVIIDKVPGTSGDALVYLGDTNDHDYIEISTFTGGVKVNGGILAIGAGANPSSGGAIGKGTFTLAGGNFKLASFSTVTIANAVKLDANATILSEPSLNHTLELSGTVIFGGHRLTKEHTGELLFSNPTFATGTLGYGTLAISSGSVNFNITGTNTAIFGGAVGEGTSGNLTASAINSGSGTFAALHFRVGTLSVASGTLRISQSSSSGQGGTLDIMGGTCGTSRVNNLSFSVDGAGVAYGRLDLQNNDLIVDWTGTDPLGTITNCGGTVTASGLLSHLRQGWNSGSWDGNGVITGIGQGTTAFAIAWFDVAQASASPYNLITLSGGTAIFSGQVVDNTTCGFKFVTAGDVDLNGSTNIGDFSLLGANFNTAQPWIGGDLNFDATANIGDFSILAGAFNTSDTGPLAARGGHDVADLYVAMLQYPDIYWESWLWREFWEEYFAQYESLNLGVPPPVPAYLQAQVNAARGIPEPAVAAIALVMALPRNRRRTRSAI